MQSCNPTAARCCGLGFFLFARHYSGNHYCFLFLQVLRCFSSLGWLPFGKCTFSALGCPIRKSADIMLVCSSPQLIAAYHVLNRLKKFEIVMIVDWCTYVNLNKTYSVLQLFFPICQRAQIKEWLTIYNYL